MNTATLPDQLLRRLEKTACLPQHRRFAAVHETPLPHQYGFRFAFSPFPSLNFAAILNPRPFSLKPLKLIIRLTDLHALLRAATNANDNTMLAIWVQFCRTMTYLSPSSDPFRSNDKYDEVLGSGLATAG
ncbi:hypothetical protein CORC01_06640 [Colletotrichum orchidophilum]|uniref:Uncharacterized protein n=1 Tax=Colletotrichum orchidophilum TaxID=1209926 RepID=A0A1G4B9W5_9PEZI|nr:uncharacterized protein CORC01_06640 [Colletotrichum orchidophilum]OHE98126.1 hypothetical protein CORC01_06640 [Colletotrichum orchidophilum]